MNAQDALVLGSFIAGFVVTIVLGLLRDALGL